MFLGRCDTVIWHCFRSVCLLRRWLQFHHESWILNQACNVPWQWWHHQKIMCKIRILNLFAGFDVIKILCGGFVYLRYPPVYNNYMGLFTKQFRTNSASRSMEARKNQSRWLFILHRFMAMTVDVSAASDVPRSCYGRKPGTKKHEVDWLRRTALGLSFASSLCSYCPIGRYSPTQSDKKVTCLDRKPSNQWSSSLSDPFQENSLKCPIALIYAQAFEKSGEDSNACVLYSLRKSLLDIRPDNYRNSSRKKDRAADHLPWLFLPSQWKVQSADFSNARNPFCA